MEINRKRQRKDTLYVSNRHFRKIAAQEADIISQNLFDRYSDRLSDNSKFITDFI